MLHVDEQCFVTGGGGNAVHKMVGNYIHVFFNRGNSNPSSRNRSYMASGSRNKLLTFKTCVKPRFQLFIM